MDKQTQVFLAALDPFISTNIVENVEKQITGRDFVGWGDNNQYSNFLWECYSNCATLQSIINGTADYISGNDIICNVPRFQTTINQRGDTINDLIQRIAMDYLIFGSFGIEVIRSMNGDISELYWIDINKLRSDKKNEVFFYSDDWGKSYGRVKYTKYPKFKQDDFNPSSIYYFKGNKTRTVYGTPLWNAAVKNVQIEQFITDFHLNEINNNFLSSKIISFNNGTPDDNLKGEIERNLNEKFSGCQNAGRMMITFAETKENAPEVIDLATDDFDKRYETLEKRNANQIFIAFRAIPQLFGMIVEGSGFNREEYLQAFALFNRTMVKPIQVNIIDAFDKIFNVKNSVTIVPFSVDVVEDSTNNAEQIN